MNHKVAIQTVVAETEVQAIINGVLFLFFSFVCVWIFLILKYHNAVKCPFPTCTVTDDV